MVYLCLGLGLSVYSGNVDFEQAFAILLRPSNYLYILRDSGPSLVRIMVVRFVL